MAIWSPSIMKKISETVTFFGSGPVAAKSLELLARNFSIEAVVTKPKPAHHKGSFPVINIAEKLNLPIHYVSNKVQLSLMMSITPFKSRVGVLIDFGIIVNQDVIDYFPLGIVNSHFSILPEWRGADPITFAILSGQKQTGVSLMLLVEALDEGPLLAYGEYDIPAKSTAPQLTDYLIKLSDALLSHELPRYMSGKAKAVHQEITGRDVSYSRKLTKQDGMIDWQKPAEQIEREIRAFLEWPKSRTTLAGKEVIITESHVTEKQETGIRKREVGKLFLTQGKDLAVQTGNGLLIIDKLKPAGKNEMSAEAFLAGYRQLLN